MSQTTNVVPLCMSCGGHLQFFQGSQSWKHIWVPAGTQKHTAQISDRVLAGFTPELAEVDQADHGRIEVDRKEAEARGRAMREALGHIDLAQPRVTMRLEKEEAAPPAAIPPPVEPVRPAFPSELPRTAASLLELLKANGWQTEALFARGYRSATAEAADIIVVRGQRLPNRERMVASWRDGSFELGYRLTPRLGPVKLKSTELTTYAKAPVVQCTTCGLPPHEHPMPEDSPACFHLEDT